MSWSFSLTSACPALFYPRGGVYWLPTWSSVEECTFWNSLAVSDVVVGNELFRLGFPPFIFLRLDGLFVDFDLRRHFLSGFGVDFGDGIFRWPPRLVVVLFDFVYFLPTFCPLSPLWFLNLLAAPCVPILYAIKDRDFMVFRLVVIFLFKISCLYIRVQRSTKLYFLWRKILFVRLSRLSFRSLLSLSALFMTVVFSCWCDVDWGLSLLFKLSALSSRLSAFCWHVALSGLWLYSNDMTPHINQISQICMNRSVQW